VVHVSVGFVQARDRMQQWLNAVIGECNVPMSRVVMAGFSQGAMLATDLVLRADSPPAALVIWSGAPVVRQEWKTLAPGLLYDMAVSCNGTCRWC
jgi:phospholipase/carboxylesterase